MNHLTEHQLAETARRQIAELFESHFEWFHTTDDGPSQPLKRTELDISVSNGKLILSCWTEKGTRSWRIRDWKWTGEKLVLQGSRRMGAEQPLIELIPRAAASAVATTVKAARQARCDLLAQLTCAGLLGAKIERSSLSPGVRRGHPGRYARIVLWTKYQRLAVTASVASHNASDVDALLSASLLWFTRVSERAKPPYIQQLWLVLEGELVKAALTKLALIKDGLKQAIHAFEIDNAWTELKPLQIPDRKELWQKRLKRFPPVVEPVMSESALMIEAEAPEAIDIVRARHGETLRYNGLPFARVRRVLGSERVWFGTESWQRCLLDDSTSAQWESLCHDLQTHRSETAPDHRHALYRNASEAWLESLLRRDISRLDPGLIVAPIHAQFRTAPGGRLGVRPIDLLALRRDGRLVVIELKVFEDREHVFQGVGYWQRVEAHRRRGHISRAKLFGTRRISDEPPLVYLVAPTLRVHPAFTTLARFIAPDIEIYRFDINEDWRSGVRVMRRMRAN
jgi:hypothetical protein